MIDSNVTRAGAVLTIDLDALCDNWRLLRRQAEGAECAAVVKADAYGLGAERAAALLSLTAVACIVITHHEWGRIRDLQRRIRELREFDEA